MFEKIINAVSNYDEVLRRGYEAYEKAKDELPKKYAGDTLNNLMDEATQRYQNTMANERRIAQSTIDEEFKNLFDKLNKVVTEPAPSDFISTLEAIKTNNGNLTPYEAEVYSQKYCNNYTAYKSILSVLHDHKLVNNLTIMSADAVKAELEKAKEMAESFIWNWDPHSLSNAFYLDERTNPFALIADTIGKNFISLE